MTEMSPNPFADRTQDQPENAPAVTPDNVDAPPEGGSLTNSGEIHKGWLSHKELKSHKDELVIGTTYENQTLMSNSSLMNSSDEENLPYENHSLMSSEKESRLDVIFWDHQPYLQTKSLPEKRGPSDWVMFAGYCTIKGVKFGIKLIPLTGLMEQLMRTNRKNNQYDKIQGPLVQILDTLGDKEDFYMEHPEQCPLFVSFLKKERCQKPHTFELGWHTFVVARFEHGNFELTLMMSYGEKIEMLDNVMVKAHKDDDFYKIVERRDGIRRQWHSQFVKPETKAAEKLRERLANRKRS